MTVFRHNDLSFEVPWRFVDTTLNVFVPPKLGDHSTSFTIAREPRSDGSVAEQAEAVLAALHSSLPDLNVIARRSRSIGTLAGYEALSEYRKGKLPVYQRIAFVGYYDSLLVFTVSAARARRQACNTLAERWFDSLRFRKRGL